MDLLISNAYNKKNCERNDLIMKKQFKLCTYTLILFIMMIGLFKVSPIIQDGYDLYKTAVSEVSISDRIAELREKDQYITYDEIPEEFIKQIIYSEDKRFYYHLGVDPIAIVRAVGTNIREGRYAQGGSTISQQLAKNMYFSFEKTMERKIAEAFVAFDIEKELSKNEILELYCNIAYFGEGQYGLKEAAEHYYDLEPYELSKVQTAALVFTVKCPKYYNPNVLMQTN